MLDFSQNLAKDCVLESLAGLVELALHWLILFCSKVWIFGGGGGDDKALEVLWLDELWCALSSFGNVCFGLFVFFVSVVEGIVGVASVVSVVEISLLDFALFASFVLCVSQIVRLCVFCAMYVFTLCQNSPLYTQTHTNALNASKQ